MNETHHIEDHCIEGLCIKTGMFIQRKMQDNQRWEPTGYHLVNKFKFWQRDIWRMDIVNTTPDNWEVCNG